MKICFTNKSFLFTFVLCRIKWIYKKICFLMKKIVLLFIALFGNIIAFSQALPPAPPSAVKVEQIDLENRAKVDWSPPSGTFDGYKIYYTKSGTTVRDSVRVGKVITSNITNLSLDTAYTVTLRSFRVVAPDTLYSAATAGVRVVIATLVKPTITIDHAFITHNSFMLKVIDLNKYETGFQAEVEENGFVRNVNITKTGSEIFETISSLKPKTNYKIRTRAIKGTNLGPWSDALTFTTAIDFPAKPVLQTGADCPFGASFTWTITDRLDEINTIYIQRSTDGVNFVQVDYLTPEKRGYTDTKANPGIKYYYRVITENTSGKTFSDPAGIQVKPYVAANLPTDFISLTNNRSTTHLTISWKHGTQDEVCGTNILANTEIATKVNGGEMKTIANLPNYTTVYRIEGLKPKDVVEIYLRTHSNKGILSDWIMIQDQTSGPPTAPSNFIGVAFKDVFDKMVLGLEWKDNSEDEDYFVIEKSQDGTHFQPFTFTKRNVNKLVDTDIEEGNRYYYRVLSGNWAGNSDYTPVIGPFIFDFTAIPNAPYGINLKKNGNGVDISWVDDSIKELNYIVEKSLDNEATYGVIATLNKDVTSYRDENITDGRTYFYRVVASNNLGKSGYAKSKSITLPAAASASFNAVVYPNPVKESLNIKAEGVNPLLKYHINIFDQNNRLLVNQEVKFDEEGNGNISINSLITGSYTMTISFGKEMVSKKIIKL